MRVDDKRKERRVTFARGVAVHIMAIDGTWRRACTMEDISTIGTKLSTEESIAGLNLTEFFLLLSTTGLAFRRCSLAWVNGNQFGVTFVTPPRKQKKHQLNRTG